MFHTKYAEIYLTLTQSLTLLKREGLADWFRTLKETRRDFATRMACDLYHKKISSHTLAETDEGDKENGGPGYIPQAMTRVPLTTAVDEPVKGISLANITVSKITLYFL